MRFPILIIDDDPDIRAFVVEVLRSEGYSVSEGADTAQAFEFVSALENEPSLILLDRWLNGRQSSDFVRKVKEADIPAFIVMLSGSCNGEEGMTGIEADGYLPKPFELDDLLDVITQFCPKEDSRPIPARRLRRSSRVDEPLSGQKRRRVVRAGPERTKSATSENALQHHNDYLLAISHDLKNPLTVIKGQAQFIRRQALPGNVADVPQLTRGLAQIERTVRRMTDLIDEIHDLAFQDLGKHLELDLRPTDLTQLVRQLVEEHSSAIVSHHFVFDAANTPLIGCWDRTRLQRVVENLLSNAIKYSPSGSIIRVTLSRGSGKRGSAGCVVLAVADCGIGIPSEDLPFVFDRFYRARNAHGAAPGLGIGLCTTRQIVEQHGGAITVESVETRGSIFTIRLPFEKTTASR